MRSYTTDDAFIVRNTRTAGFLVGTLKAHHVAQGTVSSSAKS